MARFLCRYSLTNSQCIPLTQAEQIRNDPETLHLFAYKRDMARFNKHSLQKIQSNENPVARLHSIYTDEHGLKTRKKRGHWDVDNSLGMDNNNLIAIGCKVELRGKNICPQQGLYNGAMGTVKDIVYKENESPNTNHLPMYVLVHFPSYSGIQFLPNEQNIIPIVPITVPCNRFCCRRTFLPITLCFAKTIHTFEGQNAGPVAEGQQRNPVQRIVVDPGDRKFEGINPGLMYTILSRATTMGDPNNVLSSAIFFDGTNINPERFQNIAFSLKKGRKYEKVVLRDKWVRYLKQHRVQSNLSDTQIQSIFNWADEFHPSRQHIDNFFYLFNNQLNT